MSLVQDFQRKRGILFVVSGPSGVGKDTVLDRALQNMEGIIKSVSATTRPPRDTERSGIDYFFYTQERFETEIADAAFLEYENYGSHFYGTPLAPVEQSLAEGTDVVLKIEVKGALNVKQLLPATRLIFIQPPAFSVLEERLIGRGKDTPEKIQQRLEIAKGELDARREYHYLITNDNLETAVNTLCAIIIAERHRIQPESS
ncbi:guanylate kinase [Armatimonadota bacterium]|nr:guanylate kinase [Armatimonadota bacterium]